MREVLPAATVMMAVAGPVLAEPWVDHELLREMHADKVEVSTDAEGNESWRLDMGDGVTVSCSNGGCVGLDDDLAMGCVFYAIAMTKAVVDACSLPITPQARDRLEQLYERFGRFVADNAVPRRNWSELRGFADSLETSTREDIAAGRDAGCTAVASHLPMQRKLDALSHPPNPDEEAGIERALSRPRLPVMLPCF